MLILDNISKDFATRAVDGVSLKFQPGQVHALLGANGAGKSTLSKIIAGMIQPTLGTMILSGLEFAPKSKSQAQKLGVQIVQQELNILPTLSLAENLFFSRLPSRLGLINRPLLRQKASQILDEFGLGQFSPDSPASLLGVGQRQILEIAANTWQPTNVLILDEPTAALSVHESETLFRKIDQWKQAGIVILYISHRLAEVEAIADQVSILRDGKLQGTWPRGQFDQKMIIQHMSQAACRTIGLGGTDGGFFGGTDGTFFGGTDGTDGTERTVGLDGTDRTEQKVGLDGTDGTYRTDVLLDVQQLNAGPKVRDISLKLHAGRILGLAGLVGSGRTELLRGIFGADQATGGFLKLSDGQLRFPFRSPSQAVRNGIVMISEDRKADGLLLGESIASNIQLPMLDLARFGSLTLYRSKQAHQTAEVYRKELNIRCDSTDQPVGTLSGGNQQKIVIAKWLLRDADVFLFDEPTRGIDVAARELVYKVIRDLASSGKSVLVVSSDLEELMGLCDQIGVLSNGKWVATFPGPDFDPQQMVQAMFSGFDDPTQRSN